MRPAPPVRFLAIALLLGAPRAALAQATGLEERDALAVAEAALAAVTAEDVVALTDLMVDEAIIFTVSGPDGDLRFSIRTRAEQRSRGFSGDIIERGFDPRVRVASGLATVWLPYDLYVNGSWSHCGVDVFSLLRVDGEWRILTMGWTVEQPPACERHPDGPPTAGP
ncbi:MAG: hypothetical protein O2956_15295 [Gemmatimonadetes bacterium]|nr:hypothetical protein [Gemmatimonadota bacterium]